MRHVLFVLLLMITFGCSEKIPFEKQIKELSIETTGIEPIVISVSIDSIVPPDSTRKIYEAAYEVKQTHLVLFNTRLVRSYQGLVEASEVGKQIWKLYPEDEIERRRKEAARFKDELTGHEKRLSDVKNGKHPELDSINQLILNPKEWQQVTARFKNSETSPVMVRKIIFAVGTDTTIVEKIF